MLTHFQQMGKLSDLREYVSATICSHCQLQEGAYSLTERVLLRGGKRCGIYFCLQGPRATKFSAIWDSDQNQVLFYGSRGEKFLKAQLPESPDWGSAAA
jgi:hypothetical protein